MPAVQPLAAPMWPSIIDSLLAGRRARLGRRFDRRHGVETTATLARDDLVGMPPDLREHAGEYAPSNIALFRRMIRKSGVDPSEFIFVDLGCGKGRIALAAADYPFKAIIGVEADAGLYRIAVDNLQRWRPRDHACRVSFVHADARTAELPAGNLFIFMYSPFRGPVFQQVAERLAMVARDPGRAMIVAYSADWEANALERTGVFTRVRMPRRKFWKPSVVSFFYNEAALAMRR
jgi:SAM-dependent methyltransferase